jgi:hypothetical protein
VPQVATEFGAAERDERDTQVEQGAGPRVVGRDVVEHERVGRPAAVQPLRGGDLTGLVLGRVDEEMPVGLPSGLGEGVQEPVMDRGQGAGRHRLDPIADRS